MTSGLQLAIELLVCLLRDFNNDNQNNMLSWFE